MTDPLASRLRVGIVVPSFNVTVQPEMEAMRPPGVTNHVSRIEMPDTPLTSDAEQEAVVASLGADLYGALRRVMGARPGVVVFGISIPTFWTGIDGMCAMREQLGDAAGVPVILGAEAILAALGTVPGAPRLGVITPYQPIADEKVRSFLEEAGHSVAAVRSVRARRSSLIADVTSESIRAAVSEVTSAGAQLVIQVGTNLPFASTLGRRDAVADGVPVMAINTACYWLALRTAGVSDRIRGFGAPLDCA